MLTQEICKQAAEYFSLYGPCYFKVSFILICTTYINCDTWEHFHYCTALKVSSAILSKSAELNIRQSVHQINHSYSMISQVPLIYKLHLMVE